MPYIEAYHVNNVLTLTFYVNYNRKNIKFKLRVIIWCVVNKIPSLKGFYKFINTLMVTV